MIILVFNEVASMISNSIHFTNEYMWFDCSNCNNRKLTLLRSVFLLRCKCGSVSIFKNNITTILCA